ncbi:hypothetical protein BZA77DRAFT_298010 [Pyronema omphalodes]|nr:hypothetical protein BZA77DRAFT_298010 [Pyronema omphalodes]
MDIPPEAISFPSFLQLPHRNLLHHHNRNNDSSSLLRHIPIISGYSEYSIQPLDLDDQFCRAPVPTFVPDIIHILESKPPLSLTDSSPLRQPILSARSSTLIFRFLAVTMEYSSFVNCNNVGLRSPSPEMPIEPILSSRIPAEPVTSALAPMFPAAGSSGLTPAAVIPPEATGVPGSVVGSEAATSSVSVASSGAAIPPALLQSTLTDYHRISSPAPAHGLPVVSIDEEQSLLTNLSSHSSLQRDITIRPFAFMAALPTAAEVVQICEVPETLYGRLKLEMYPIPVQKRAVMRMWRVFHWNWNNEADVRKFVSKRLGERFHQSKRAADKKMAKLAAGSIANAGTTVPDASVALTTTTNFLPNDASPPALADASSSDCSGPLPEAVASADLLPPDSAAVADVSSSDCSSPLATAATVASAPSSESSASIAPMTCPVTGWVVPDVHLARAFMGDDYWGIVDSVISDETSRAFRNWDEPVPAVAVHLQDWMYKTGFIDYEDIMLLEEDEH